LTRGSLAATDAPVYNRPMESEPASPARGARVRVWRDTAAAVVFHGLEFACLLFALVRLPDLGALLGALDGAPPGAPARFVAEACAFVREEQIRLALLLIPFLVFDALVMAWLWRAPDPRGAKLWFTAIGLVPVAVLAAVVAAALVPIVEAYLR